MTNNSSNSANLYSVFNLLPITAKQEVAPVVEEQSTPSKIVNDDFETARENLHKMIKTGHEALENLAVIADQSQDAEAYTGLSSLLNSLIQANRELLALSKKRQEFERQEAVKAGPAGEGGDVINNNLFIGSTAELLDMIDNLEKKED